MYHIGWSLCQIIETSPLYAPVVAEWPSRWVFEVGESPSALMCVIQDLSPCLSAPAGASKVPPRQQYMAQCHGQLEFWATAPLTNMNCFTHLSTIELEAYKEPRMPNVCVGHQAPSPGVTFQFSNMERAGFSNLIMISLKMRPVHDPYVKKPFPSMVASRTHLHVTGTADWMGLLAAPCPL